MSVYKRCSSTDRRITRIAERISYVFDMQKTRPELCHTVGVTCRTAYEDMIFVKRLYVKMEGRQYLHWILSYDADVSQEVADEVGREVLKLLNGEYQAIMATHINTDNFHNHFLINPVNLKTGNKFSESISDMIRFRDRINVILKAYGLNEIGKIENFDEENEEENNVICQSNYLYEPSYLSVRGTQMYTETLVDVSEGTLIKPFTIDPPKKKTIRPFTTQDTLIKPIFIPKEDTDKGNKK